MSRVLCVFGNLKGGVGKSTTVMLAAHAAAEATGGDVLVVDLDSPQHTARRWWEIAAEDGHPLPFRVEALGTPVRRGALDALVATAGVVLVDTPPRPASVLEDALVGADLLVVPTGSHAADVDRVEAAVAATAVTRTPFVVVAVKVRAGTTALADLEVAAQAADWPLCSTRIGQRERYGNAFGERVGGHELGEARALWAEIVAAVEEIRSMS